MDIMTNYKRWMEQVEETDPAQWSGIVGDATNGYCGPSSSDSTWNALTYDKEADGYRLPTEAEWEYIARERVVTDEHSLSIENVTGRTHVW